MKPFKHASLLASATLLGACTTHLDVVQISPNNPQHRIGAPYYLPFTQFDATVTWSPSCKKSNTAAENGLFSLRANTSVKAKAVRDPRAMYLIDYTSMDSALKTTSVSAEFYEETGFLKSINASADDQLVETLTATASVVGNLASLGVGGSGARYCSPQLIADLAEVESKTADLASAASSLAAASNALKLRQAAVLRAGGQMDQSTLAELNALVSNVQTSIALKDIAATALATAKQKVTYSKTVKFPSDSATSERAEPLAISEEKLGEWIVLRDAAGTEQTLERGALTLEAESLKVRLELQSEWIPSANPVRSEQQAPQTPQPSPTAQVAPVAELDPEAGIRYRVAVPASLRTCLGTGSTCDKTVEPRVQVTELPVQIMHSNSTFYLPFESRSFTNASLTASFSKNGALTSFGYVQSESAAANAAGAAGNLTSTVLGIGPARRARELERLQAQAGILEAEANLAALEAAAARQDASDSTNEAASQAEAEAELIELEASFTIRAVQSMIEGESQ